MARPRVLILRAAGTNCDRETAYAFELAGAEAEIVHVNEFTRGRRALREFQLLALPGGFSYGDDVSAGRIHANELRFLLADELDEFLAAGKLILGICNGFQVLVKTGILPGSITPTTSPDPLLSKERASTPSVAGGISTKPFPGEETAATPSIAGETSPNHLPGKERSADLPPVSVSPSHPHTHTPLHPHTHTPTHPQSVTLADNLNARFQCRWVRLKVNESAAPAFLAGMGGEVLEVPIAHGEGRFFAQPETLGQLRSRDQVALQYCGPGGELDDRYNVNGSALHAAGISGYGGQVLGLMPHPERYVHGIQHPRWTRTGLHPEGQGLRIFRNAVEYLRA